MEQSINVSLIGKEERHLNAIEERTTKKVKVQVHREAEQAMETEDSYSTPTESHYTTETQRDLLKGSSLPETVGKAKPFKTPNAEECLDQSMALNEVPLNSDRAPANQSKLSFKEKLIGASSKENEETEPTRDELILEDEDVIVEIDGQVPAINFSKRIKDMLIDHM